MPKSSGGVEDHEEGHEEAMPKSVLKAMKEKEKSAAVKRQRQETYRRVMVRA